MPGHPYFEPVRLLHVCPVPGCAELVPYGQPRYEQHSRGSDRRSRAYRKARELVLERDRRRCQPVALGANAGECSRRLQAHHILEVAEGGTDAPENLVALCRTHYHVARRRGRRRFQREASRPPPGRIRGPAGGAEAVGPSFAMAASVRSARRAARLRPANR